LEIVQERALYIPYKGDKQLCQYGICAPEEYGHRVTSYDKGSCRGEAASRRVSERNAQFGHSCKASHRMMPLDREDIDLYGITTEKKSINEHDKCAYGVFIPCIDALHT